METSLDHAWALRLVGLVLGVMALEALLLLLWLRHRGELARAPDLVWNLLAGAGLALALHGVLAQTGLASVVAGLALSGVAHVIDLWRRLGPVARRGSALAANAAAERSRSTLVQTGRK